MRALAIWWETASPVLEAIGILLGLVLGVVNLTWLAVQARRSKLTHGIAVEAHDWARERREREQAKARDEDAKRAWWRQIRETIAASDGPILLPDGVDPAWITEAEQLGYFRLTKDSYGADRLAKPDPLASAGEQKRAERRAVLAEEALHVIHSACWLVHHWAVILCMETTQERGTPSADLEGIRSAVAFGADAVGPLRQRIREALRRALVQLNDTERQLLSDAEGVVVQLQLDADGWLKDAESIDRGHARDVFMRVYRAANELEVRARRQLGPVARFGQP